MSIEDRDLRPRGKSSGQSLSKDTALPGKPGSGRRSVWLVYAFAVGVTAATLLLRMGLGVAFGDRPLLILLLLPIILSAHLGGIGPGLVSTLVAALGVDYYMIPPTYSFGFTKSEDLAQWVILIVNGAFISVLNEALHRSRRQAETSWQLHAVMLAGIADAVITTDNHGNVTLLNVEAARLTGWTHQEAQGQPVSAVLRIIDEDTRQSVGDPVKKALESGKLDNTARRSTLVARDGREISIEESSALIRRGDGAPLGVVLVFRDCTEKRKAEKTLRNSEERFRAMFELASVGIAQADPHTGRFQRVNERLCVITGYGADELVGMLFFEIFLPEDRQREREAFQGIVRGEMSGYLHEKRCVRKDGAIVWVSVNLTVLSDEGRPVFILAVVEDITERRLAEESLRDERKRLNEIIEFLPDPTFVVDTEGKVIAWNRAIEEMTGVSKSDMIQKGNYEYAIPFYGERRPILIDLILKPAPELEQKGYEDIHRHERILYGEAYVPQAFGGKGAYLWATASLLRDSSGNVVGAIESIRDITERKRMENALEKRLVALTRPLDTVEGIEFEDLFNLEEIQNLQYQFAKACNVASLITHPNGDPITKPSNFCRLCETVIRRTEKGFRNCRYSDSVIGRYNPEGPVVETCLSGGLLNAGAGIIVGGRHIANWLVGQVRNESQGEDKMRAYARDIGADEEEFMQAFREVPSMSKEQFENIAQALFTLAGQLSSMAYQNIQQARFITESKRAEAEREKLEAQLHQAQKIESVGRLAGGVAHDFNNMLGVIIGHADMAIEQTASGEPLYHDLTEIRKAATRSADLTRQLLAFARRQTVSPKVLDLNETITGMLKMLRRLIGEDVDLVWIPGHGLWKVKVDPSQIDHILANLTVNARDAIAGTGSITIKTENITVDASNRPERLELTAGDYVLLTVSDTGEGMDSSTLDLIFEPFFTTKEVGRGTGLGLATVYGIVKQNNGFIYADSRPGMGAAFQIYLPSVQAEPEQTTAGEAARKPQGGKETVLLVEDDESMLSLSKKMLDSLGYTVLCTQAPKEAIRLAEDYLGGIDLLITDVVMPEMNGRELSDRIRGVRPGTGCLYMSGYTADMIAHRGVLDEGVHFIHKPFSLHALASKIREVLEAK